MKSEAALVGELGGPEVLTLRPITLPLRPARGEVRIRVHAAGVAFGDVMRRRGMPGMSPRRPFAPGYDVAGVVEAAGPGASITLGARVAAMMPKVGVGGYARHVDLPADHLVPIPDATPFDIAVALGLNYITAWQMLHRLAGVRAGATILIHGAAGGVGTALLELARDAGVTAWGTASAPKHPRVRALGGRPIDYRREDFEAVICKAYPHGIDAAFDGIGGANLSRSYRTLARGGTLVSFGLSGEAGPLGALRTAGHLARACLRPDGRRVRFYAITVSPGARPAECRQDWARLLQMHASGRLDPVIGARLPLAEAAEAHRLLEGAKVEGKIVLLAA